MSRRVYVVYGRRRTSTQRLDGSSTPGASVSRRRVRLERNKQPRQASTGPACGNPPPPTDRGREENDSILYPNIPPRKDPDALTFLSASAISCMASFSLPVLSMAGAMGRRRADVPQCTERRREDEGDVCGGGTDRSSSTLTEPGRGGAICWADGEAPHIYNLAPAQMSTSGV